MEISEKYIRILEFDKILELIKKSSTCKAALEKIDAIRPTSDIAKIKRMLRETSSAKKLISLKGMPNFDCHITLPDIIERSKKGALLNTTELLRVATLLNTTQGILNYAENLSGDDRELDEVIKRLIPSKSLEKEIRRSVLDEETIADDATHELYNIRKKKLRSASKIRDILQHYISGAYSNFLQENIITFRNSRFVIPVKSEYKNEIKGLVHDTSASGSTVFIEPLSVVELNNEIKILESEEKNEIEKILRNLSNAVNSFAEALYLDYINIVDISIIFAKADLAFKMDAVEPEISQNGKTEFVKARHPLLDKKKAVPISLSLGEKFDTLIITGPNTGGKTVTLKTVGLLSIMAQCGMQLPCDEATVPVYEKIFADIGDEQSIEQSLSTFSAHLVNIIETVNNVGKNSLCLFDELGSGTDPVEGASLAEAILEKVREKGSKCVATTHYPELKKYAIETQGVENASCEFDISTLKPTYRLVLGTPGRSNAFLISEKLGMPKEIIERAKALVDEEDQSLENIISKLEAERVELEKNVEIARKNRIDAEKMMENAASDRKAVLESAEKELERAKKEATRLVLTARDAFDKTFDELDEIKKEFEKKKNIEMLEKGRENIRKNLSMTENDISMQSVDDGIETENYVLPRELIPGDAVFVTSVGKEGTVEKVGKEVFVTVGNIRMKTDIKYIRLLNKKTSAKKPVKVKTSPRNMINSSVDVRGLVTEDAWFVVDKYFDDAVLSGLKNVTVIHGKGTGQLKAGLTRYFKKDRRIKSFRPGMWGEGDGGVTIVELL